MILRGMLCSHGETSARVFVAFDVPPAGPKPRDECERVILTPPPDVPRRAMRVRGAGARRPDQGKLEEARPAVVFQPGRTALQTQEIVVDRALMAGWIAAIERERAEGR